MILSTIINTIRQNGINEELNSDYKLNIEISNVFNVISILLTFPFILILRETPKASILASIPILAFIASLLLIRYQQYKIGRLVFSLTTPTTIYILAALLYNDYGTDGMAVKFLLIADVMLPFMVFCNKEWKMIVPILLINLFYLVSFNYVNEILNITNIKYISYNPPNATS